MAVKRTLPPEAQLWGRSIESRLSSIEATQGSLSALIGSSNSRLSSVLLAQQALAAQQTTLSEQVEFLTNQVAYNATDASVYNYFITAPRSSYEVPYDPNCSAELTFTTSSTGRIAVESACSWSVYLSNDIYFDVSFTAYVEILQGTTIVKGWTTGAPQVFVARDNSYPASGTSYNAAESESIMSVLDLSPDTTYTARTRLQVHHLVADNDLNVSPMSLKITKLGM